MKELYKQKKCTICGESFSPKMAGQNTCSFNCRLIKKRDAAKKYARIRRKKLPIGKCFICGFDKAIDVHHEGGKEYRLCPNHHAMITRGVSTLEILIKEYNVEKL